MISTQDAIPVPSPRYKGPTPHQRACIEHLLGQVMPLYPDGKIPPKEGGHVFRSVSRRVPVEEQYISDIARTLGYWDASPYDIERDCEDITCSDEALREMLSDPWEGRYT
jgi:hypothetical protein